MSKDKPKKNLDLWRKKLQQAERYRDAAAKDLKMKSIKRGINYNFMSHLVLEAINCGSLKNSLT